MQRQHLWKIQPLSRCLHPWNPPSRRYHTRYNRRPAAVQAAHTCLLCRWSPRPDPPNPPTALGKQVRSRRTNPQIPPKEFILLWDDEEEPLLYMPQRVRGGEPENGWGPLFGLCTGVDQGQLRHSVQRCSELGDVCCDYSGAGYPELEEDTDGDYAEGLCENAAAGDSDEATFWG